MRLEMARLNLLAGVSSAFVTVVALSPVIESLKFQYLAPMASLPGIRLELTVP